MEVQRWCKGGCVPLFVPLSVHSFKGVQLKQQLKVQIKGSFTVKLQLEVQLKVHLKYSKVNVNAEGTDKVNPPPPL